MFDQNGVAGMLMAKLNITKSLNIVIDSSVEFPPKPQINSENKQYVRNMVQDMSTAKKDFKIFDDVMMFRQYCMAKNKVDDGKKMEIMEDCCNLYFDDGPEVYLS